MLRGVCLPVRRWFGLFEIVSLKLRWFSGVKNGAWWFCGQSFSVTVGQLFCVCPVGSRKR